jgi:hypothetical protein
MWHFSKRRITFSSDCLSNHRQEISPKEKKKKKIDVFHAN